MDRPFCFDCRFFVPTGMSHNDLAPGQWSECMEGECRRNPPRLGMLLTDRNGDDFRHYGEWPKVMAADWCGEFKPRQNATCDVAAQTRHVGPRSNMSCGAGQGCQAGRCQTGQDEKDGQ
ncbi:MAG TPA: hypothetical protein PLD58_25505 [Phycisphaerae bacterium]|nr:hypothetical protein [Phycisphaerae bacterium]